MNESKSKSEKAHTTSLVWANIYLDAQQKEAAKLFCADSERVLAMWETLLTDGYSVSFSFSEKTDSDVCTIIGKTCPEGNRGVGMTTHGGDVFSALYRALYKHFVICADCTWLEAAGDTNYPTP